MKSDKEKKDQVWWVLSVFPATWKMELRRVKVQGQPRKRVVETPSQTIVETPSQTINCVVVHGCNSSDSGLR
jgi:hypothetical protein